jgi:hypothetical protein
MTPPQKTYTPPTRNTYGASPFHKLVALLSGTDLALLGKSPKSVHSAASVMAMMVAFAAFITSSSMTYGLGYLGLRLTGVALVGFWLAFFGFMLALERSIASPTSHGWLSIITRWCFAIIFALVHSFFVDLGVFRTDIEQQLQADFRQEMSLLDSAAKLEVEEKRQLIENLKQERQIATVRIDSFYQDAKLELEGRSATNRPGPGGVYRLKKEKAEEEKMLFYQETKPQMDRDIAALELAITQSATKLKQKKETLQNQHDNGILAALDAMHRIVTENPMVMLFYLLLLFMSVGMEVAPLLVKISQKDAWADYNSIVRRNRQIAEVRDQTDADITYSEEQFRKAQAIAEQQLEQQSTQAEASFKSEQHTADVEQKKALYQLKSYQERMKKLLDAHLAFQNDLENAIDELEGTGDPELNKDFIEQFMDGWRKRISIQLRNVA